MDNFAEVINGFFITADMENDYDIILRIGGLLPKDKHYKFLPDDNREYNYSSAKRLGVMGAYFANNYLINDKIKVKGLYLCEKEKE